MSETDTPPPKTGIDTKPSWWQILGFITPIALLFATSCLSIANRVTILEQNQVELRSQVVQQAADNKDLNKALNAVLQRLERIESKQDSGNERLRELLSRK